jgi:hypothetical protein
VAEATKVTSSFPRPISRNETTRLLPDVAALTDLNFGATASAGPADTATTAAVAASIAAPERMARVVTGDPFAQPAEGRSRHWLLGHQATVIVSVRSQMRR